MGAASDGGGSGDPPAWTLAIDRCLRVPEVAAAAVLVGLMAITCIDVAGRELANAPLPGATELTRLCLAALVFCALPVVSWNDQHIVVDLLDGVFSARLAGLRQLVVGLVAAVGLAAVAARAWHFAGRSAEFGDVTEYLHLPVAPIVYLIGALSGVAALLSLLGGVRSMLGHRPRPAAALSSD